jgi:hypothetical protein
MMWQVEELPEARARKSGRAKEKDKGWQIFTKSKETAENLADSGGEDS